MARITSLLPLHLGRITTYTFFGALIGLAGSLLDQAGGMMGWQGAFSVIVGIVMFLVSLSLLGILPPIEATLMSLTVAVHRWRACAGFSVNAVSFPR